MHGNVRSMKNHGTITCQSCLTGYTSCAASWPSRRTLNWTDASVNWIRKSIAEKTTDNTTGRACRRRETNKSGEAGLILDTGEETIYVVEGKVILVPFAGIDEDRISGEPGTASSNTRGGERGGRGSESQEVRPSDQKDSAWGHCNVSFKRVDTGVEPEGADQADLAKK